MARKSRIGEDKAIVRGRDKGGGMWTWGDVTYRGAQGNTREHEEIRRSGLDGWP